MDFIREIKHTQKIEVYLYQERVVNTLVLTRPGDGDLVGVIPNMINLNGELNAQNVRVRKLGGKCDPACRKTTRYKIPR